MNVLKKGRRARMVILTVTLSSSPIQAMHVTHTSTHQMGGHLFGFKKKQLKCKMKPVLHF